MAESQHALHIVLYEPEIANNVGAIMRICYALNAKLHLIQPFGFFFDERFFKRASVTYFDKTQYQVYDDYADFMRQNPDQQTYYATRYGSQAHSGFDFTLNDKPVYLMFGRESTGIPKDILRSNLKTCFRIPMQPKARCLNIATSVAISAYEFARQNEYQGLSFSEVQKGADFLTKDQ